MEKELFKCHGRWRLRWRLSAVREQREQREQQEEIVMKRAYTSMSWRRWCKRWWSRRGLERAAQAAKSRGRERSATPELRTALEGAEIEYTSCVMCRAKFYKQWSAERICDECEETQAAQEDEHNYAHQASGIKTSKPDFFTHISCRRK